MDLITWATQYAKKNFFEVWWCDHYKVPLNDSRLDAVTDIEMMQQFYLYFVVNHPDEVARIMLSQVQPNTQVVTGDERIDELERMLAKGEELPDLVDHLVAPKEREAVRSFLMRRALENMAHYAELQKKASPQEEPDYPIPVPSGMADYIDPTNPLSSHLPSPKRGSPAP